MLYQYGAVLVFIVLGVAFVVGSLLIGSLIRISKHSDTKTTIYECGEPTIGSSWIRYNSRFYNVALVYLLFDVEVVILIPAVLVFKDSVSEGKGAAASVAILVFILLLVVGLAYEWFYGNLDWIRKDKVGD